jgi:hypothetical protein
MRAAAILAMLACGMTLAMWMRLAPSPEFASLTPGLGLVAGSLAAGLLIDRGKRKAALVGGLALLCASLWYVAAAPWYVAATAGPLPWFRLGAAALGLGGGMAFLAANATMAASATGSRAAALNLLHLLPPVGVFSISVLSARTVTVAAALLAALALGVAVWKPMPAGALAQGAKAETAARRGGTVLLVLALLLFLYAIGEAATWNWMVGYLDAARVLDQETTRLILSTAFPLGLVVGRIGISRILRNVAPITVARMASFAMAFTTALMLLARSPSASWVGGFAVGVAMAAILPTVLGAAYDALPRWPATGMGVVLATGWIGLAASSPLIVQIADRSSLLTAMLALPVVSLGMGLLAMGVGRSRSV